MKFRIASNFHLVLLVLILAHWEDCYSISLMQLLFLALLQFLQNGSIHLPRIEVEWMIAGDCSCQLRGLLMTWTDLLNLQWRPVLVVGEDYCKCEKYHLTTDIRCGSSPSRSQDSALRQFHSPLDFGNRDSPSRCSSRSSSLQTRTSSPSRWTLS